MRLLLLSSMIVALSGCKTSQASSVASAGTVSESLACQPEQGLTAICTVVSVEGRLDTPTEKARTTRLSEIEEVRFMVPPASSTAQAVISFHKKKGEKEAWRIDQGLDLYDRHHCIAQVSGGVFAEDYSPRFTFRGLFNVNHGSRNGFAEVSEYGSGGAVHATVTLDCAWSR